MRAPVDPRRAERAETPVRRRLVHLLFLFYGLLLAEGALRKWVFPGASNALVFLRDPLMLMILAAYLRLGPSHRARHLLLGLAAVLLCFTLCALCQSLTSPVPALVLLAGARNYFFFVPLCFAIHDAFLPRDYARWVRINLIIAGPIAALVLLQYQSSPSATVNAVPGGGNDGVFMLVEDVVRPYGLFSFALGHSAYAAWMAGVALAALTARRALAIGWPTLAWGLGGIAVMGILSGSRTYFVLAASVLVIFFAVAAVIGSAKTKRASVVAAACLVAAGIMVLVAVPSIADHLLDRQAAAVASEGSTAERAMRVVTDFWGELGRVPMFGYGLGAGTNVANFLANGRTDYVLAEYELTRIVQELGPLFGVLYILLRWGFLAWCVALACDAMRRQRNLQPLCYLGFLVPVFLAHDITLQNSMIGIGWYSAGVFLSAVRVGPVLMADAVTGSGAASSSFAGARPCG